MNIIERAKRTSQLSVDLIKAIEGKDWDAAIRVIANMRVHLDYARDLAGELAAMTAKPAQEELPLRRETPKRKLTAPRAAPRKPVGHLRDYVQGRLVDAKPGAEIFVPILDWEYNSIQSAILVALTERFGRDNIVVTRRRDLAAIQAIIDDKAVAS